MRRPDWFLPGLGLAVLLAWLWPEPGAKGGILHAELLTKLGVSLIFFLHGLTLASSALAAGTRNWRLHLLIQLCTFVYFPLLGIALVIVLRHRVDESLLTGLFFLCALPSTVSSSVALTAAARGNVPAALFNATLSSLIGVVLTPLWLALVLGATGASLPFGRVVLDLCIWLVLPLFVGQALRPIFGNWAMRHKARLAVADRLTILMLVYTSFCDSVRAGVWRSGLTPLFIAGGVAAVLLALALVVVGWLGKRLGFSREDRIAALFCGSKKTLASGVPMARLIFGAQAGVGLILLPIMVYHSLQLVVGGFIAARLTRASGDRASSAAGS